MVELRKITEDNFADCLSLKAAVDQTDFVDSVAYSLAEAWLYYADTIPWAIYLADQLIGFVSIYVGENHYQVINFLIDSQFQNQGYGYQAANLCLQYLKTNYQAELVSLPVHEQNVRAINFWQKVGFTASDNVEDHYIWLRRKV